jgi:hypothetical protein
MASSNHQNHGTTDIETHKGGGYMEDKLIYIRIKPKKKWSWGIDEPVFVEGSFNAFSMYLLCDFYLYVLEITKLS